MATPAQRTNTWTLDEWYDQSVAGTQGSYVGVSGLYIWGNNEQGQLGQNSLVRYSSPVQLPGTTWKEVTLSGSYGSGMAPKTDGTLWVWGHSSYGGWLGLNQPTNTHLSSPTQIPGTTWEVPRGGGGVSAMKNDNSLLVWVGLFEGSLGLNQAFPGGSVVRYSSPIQLPGTTWDTGFQKFSTGATTMGAVTTEGKLLTWGRNDIGQLGINKNSARSSPTQVGTDTNWDKVDMGFYFGLATKTDGTLWGFGMNSSGQLGQNTTQSPGNHGLSSPVQIPGTNWATAISDLGSGVIATKTDGTAWAWGSNTYGRLGQNNNTGYSSPVQIPGNGWRTDATHGIIYSSLVTKTNGSLWAWGSNNFGQQGVNDRTTRSSPIQVPGTWTQAYVGGRNADGRTSAGLKKS